MILVIILASFCYGFVGFFYMLLCIAFGKKVTWWKVPLWILVFLGIVESDV
jgi:hypothetical protein